MVEIEAAEDEISTPSRPSMGLKGCKNPRPVNAHVFQTPKFITRAEKTHSLQSQDEIPR